MQFYVYSFNLGASAIEILNRFNPNIRSIWLVSMKLYNFEIGLKILKFHK